MNNPQPQKLVQLGLPSRVSRRQAIQWVMAAAGASVLATDALALPVGRTPTPQEDAVKHLPVSGNGYGPDPKLAAAYEPGAFWPLTFNESQRKTATALADVILPADDFGPAASEVGVVAMLDEWVSAPYPQQLADRPVLLEGLAWIEAESSRRFSKPFPQLSKDQQHALCDDICRGKSAKPEFQAASQFFNRFRSVCASAYYATPAGWKAIGYVGNIPLDHFEGPPPEVLKKLSVTQTVA